MVSMCTTSTSVEKTHGNGCLVKAYPLNCMPYLTFIVQRRKYPLQSLHFGLHALGVPVQDICRPALWRAARHCICMLGSCKVVAACPASPLLCEAKQKWDLDSHANLVCTFWLCRTPCTLRSWRRALHWSCATCWASCRRKVRHSMLVV